MDRSLSLKSGGAGLSLEFIRQTVLNTYYVAILSIDFEGFTTFL